MKYGVICTIVCSLSPRRRHLACVTTDEKNSGPRFVIRPLNLICCTLGADYCVWQSRGDVWFTCLNLVFARWQPGDVAARPESPRQPRDERDKNGISAPLTLIIRRNCNNDCNWNDSAIEASRFVCTLLAYVRGLNIISNLEIETIDYIMFICFHFRVRDFSSNIVNTYRKNKLNSFQIYEVLKFSIKKK